MKHLHRYLVLALLIPCMLFSQDGNSLFVLNGNGQTITKVLPESGQVIQEFAATRDIPNDIARYNDHILILNSTPASLDIISPTDGSRINVLNLTAGSNPYAMHVDGDDIYLTGLVSNRLYKINGPSMTLEDSVGAGVAPQGVSTDREYIYVTSTGGWQNNYTPSTVHIIEKTTFTPVDTLEVSANPQRLAWAPDGKLHVLCTGNYASIAGHISVIDPAEIAVDTTVFIGGAPGHLLITPNGAGYLSDYGQDTGEETFGFLYYYHTGNLNVTYSSSNPVPVGYGAMGMAYDSTRNRLYLANFGDDRVQEIDPRDFSVTHSYQAGDGPQELLLWNQPTTAIADRQSLPEFSTLSQNHPNPFNSKTRLKVQLPRPEEVTLQVFDLSGSPVTTILSGALPEGIHTFTWNGLNDMKQPVPSGIYFATMHTGSGTQTIKMHLIR